MEKFKVENFCVPRTFFMWDMKHVESIEQFGHPTVRRDGALCACLGFAPLWTRLVLCGAKASNSLVGLLIVRPWSYCRTCAKNPLKKLLKLWTLFACHKGLCLHRVRIGTQLFGFAIPNQSNYCSSPFDLPSKCLTWFLWGDLKRKRSSSVSFA